MDLELLNMIFRIAIVLPFILILVYISLKYGGTKLQKMQDGKFIKILEKVPVSKDNSIMVVKMGNKAYVVTSTNSKIDILRELNGDEEVKLAASREIPQFASLKDFYLNIKRKGREK